MSLKHEEDDDCSISKPIEHGLSTPPTVSGSTNMRLPSHKKRKNRSEAWNHFIQLEPKSDKRAQCKYCDILIRYEKGTTSMRNHVLRCPNNPNKEVNKRQKVSASSTTDGNINSLSYGRFDQELCQEELLKMFVEAELPFRFVEHVAFRRYLNALQPRFKIPSRHTLSQNIVTLWNARKVHLKNFLSQHCQRVCLTTDTWTSPQNQSYMCLTAHFIDNDWNLYKKILNFRQVISHTGEAIAKFVESCLHEWGLSRVLTLTVDYATSNDTRIQHLKQRLLSWNNLVLKGEYIHMRSCAHILSLIVSSGLKEINKYVLRIRAAVKYIRSSPSRFMKFKECVGKQNIEHKGHICLDVETRWDSTYLMLDAAFKHKKAFDEFGFHDTEYANELGKGIGLPSYEDWGYVESILPFLSIFYEATLRISGTSYVTSNMYMLEVFGIWNGINHLLKSNGTSSATYKMAEKMKKKYVKYWGEPNKMNMLLLIAVVLDPRYKMGYMNWTIDQLFDPEKTNDGWVLKSRLDISLKLLFDEYKSRKEGVENVPQQTHAEIPSYKNDPYGWNKFLQTTGLTSSNKSELQKYLEEELEITTNLSILDWWKVNSGRFPILSNIARELLAMPVSTVASESAFSTRGRVLDPYRSSLSHQKVEALICTQDWLRDIPLPSLLDYDFEELQCVDQELVSNYHNMISLS